MARPYYWFMMYSQHQHDLQRGRVKTPWPGPVKQAYIPEQGDPVILDITNSQDMYRISLLRMDQFVGVATQRSDGKWFGEHSLPRQRVYVHIDGDRSTDKLEEMVAQIRVSVQEHTRQEAEIAANPVFQLERELRGKDWTSHMSDDHAHWAAGEASDRRIRELQEQIPADEFQRIWDRYVPKS
jgi:hypothetical protein